MTRHIILEPHERPAEANALFFPQQNLIVSFPTRAEANAVVENAGAAIVDVVPLYGPEAKHGA